MTICAFMLGALLSLAGHELLFMQAMRPTVLERGATARLPKDSIVAAVAGLGQMDQTRSSKPLTENTTAAEVLHRDEPSITIRQNRSEERV